MKFCKFKSKRVMVWKLKAKLNSKFVLKWNKTIKTMKESKNRRGLAQKLYKFFLHKNKQEISIYYDNKEIHAKNIFSGCIVRSGHRIDISKCKINWERTIKRLHDWAIYLKDFPLMGFRKNVQDKPPEVFCKRRCS